MINQLLPLCVDFLHLFFQATFQIFNLLSIILLQFLQLEFGCPALCIDRKNIGLLRSFAFECRFLAGIAIPNILLKLLIL